MGCVCGGDLRTGFLRCKSHFESMKERPAAKAGFYCWLAFRGVVESAVSPVTPPRRTRDRGHLAGHSSRQADSMGAGGHRRDADRGP